MHASPRVHSAAEVQSGAQTRDGRRHSSVGPHCRHTVRWTQGEQAVTAQAAITNARRHRKAEGPRNSDTTSDSILRFITWELLASRGACAGTRHSSKPLATTERSFRSSAKLLIKG